MNDVLKEYLVALGFKVDSQSLNRARHAMNEVGSAISTLSNVSTARFAEASTAVVSFVASATIALGHFVSELAKTELEMQMFGRQMFTSTDNATAFTNSLNAMGRTMEELYLSPELISQFKELQNLSLAMRPPTEFKDQMKFIRSISFEFQKLKLEMTYGMQWIGYYVVKYLEGPLKQIKMTMQDVNGYITKNMPTWTKTIAMIVSWFAKLALALYSVKEAVLLVAGSFLALKAFNLASSPIGLMILGLTALLLLIDDYNTWKRGGKSLWGDTWESMTDSGVFEAFQDIKDAIMELGPELSKVVKSMGEFMLSITDKDGVIKAFKLLLDGVSFTINAIADGLKLIADLVNGDFSKALESSGIGNVIDSAKALDKAIDEDLKEKYGKDDPAANSNAVDRSFIGSFGRMWNWMAGSVGKVSYTQPRAQQNTKLGMNQTNTFNVYGNDSTATAMAVSTKMNGINARNFKGVIS